MQLCNFPNGAGVTGISTFPRKIQRRIQSALQAGETVVWAGQPDPDRFMRSGYLSWLLCVPLMAASLFWIAGLSGLPVFQFGPPGHPYSPLYGIPVFLLGLAGLCIPYVMREHALALVYVITDQRAFVLEGLDPVTTRSYAPAQLVDIERIEHKDGWGDIVLEVERYRDTEGEWSTRRHGFFMIGQVRQVDRMLNKLANAARVARMPTSTTEPM